ncbi:MAG TPA: ATP-dependent DNA helicase, partial [Prevotella sp.]|nr:ATP-dependent DNA helicase [Candidatus Segatella violae]
VYELGDAIIKESGISGDIMSGKDADDLARQENLEEFLSGMSTFVEERREEGRMDEAFLNDYLQDVALLTDADSDGDKDEPRVSLMTVHAAKGLEFPTVFVVGLEENIFPSPIAAVSPRELEEERRLLYVAITRAEKHCILTNAKNRWRYGKMEFDNPSRFIDEIDSSLIDCHEEGGASFGGSTSGYGGRMPWDRPVSRPVATQFMADPKPSYTSRTNESSRSVRSEANFKSVRALNAARRVFGTSTASPSASSASLSASSSSAGGNLREGMKIEHQRFGVGTILKLEGSGENAKATVEFVHSGTKQLLLKFAKFTIIG